MPPVEQHVKALRRALTTPLRWNILRFFVNNPGTVDNVDRLAAYLGADPDQLKPELEGMAECGLLTNWGAIWGAPAYIRDPDVFTYTREPGIQQDARQLLAEQK